MILFKNKTFLESLYHHAQNSIHDVIKTGDILWENHFPTIALIQKIADNHCAGIERKVQKIKDPVQAFFKNDHGVKNYVVRFLIRAAKSPLIALFNLCNIPLQVIRFVFLLCNHPINLLLQVMHYFADFINPKNLTRLGFAMLGAALATSILLSFAIPVNLIIIALVFIALGLALGTLDAAISPPHTTKQEALQKMFFKHVKLSFAHLITGFSVSMISGVVANLEIKNALEKITDSAVIERHQHMIQIFKMSVSYANSYAQYTPPSSYYLCKAQF